MAEWSACNRDLAAVLADTGCACDYEERLRSGGGRAGSQGSEYSCSGLLADVFVVNLHVGREVSDAALEHNAGNYHIRHLSVRRKNLDKVGLVEATDANDCEIGEICGGNFDFFEHFEQSRFIFNDFCRVSAGLHMGDGDMF